MLTHTRSQLRLLAILAATTCLPGKTARAAEEVQVVSQPATESRNAYYASNRLPLLPNPLIPLPVGAVKPQGWLRKQLELQAAGFHGHLDEVSRFVRKEGNSWLSPTGEGEHGWEEVPYWLKGFSLCGYLLEDQRLINESKIWMEAALQSQRNDGWFGPRSAKATVASTEGPYDLWPNMVMLYCLQSYYDYTGNEGVLDLMKRYFRFELEIPENEFLPPYWQQQRAADNLYSVHWLYNRTGEAWLLDLAEKIHRHTANWTDSIPDWHNVNMSQAFGGPAVFYVQSGRPEHRQAAYRNYDQIRAQYGQVPGGMFGGDENCRPGYTGPRQAIETCGMVEMMLSTEHLLAITGDLTWADRCEDVAFNSLPAALTADLKGLRYLTAPNLVLSDRASKSPGLQNGGPMLLMSPHLHRCCQHNFGHGWPYFAAHLWFATPDQGLAAVFFSASEVTAKVGDGQRVTIEQQTHYPFSEHIEFRIRAEQPVEFPLYLRVPGWCQEARLSINDEKVEFPSRPGAFLRVARRWKPGDRLVWELPMQVAIRTWRENADSVSVDRGPLTYSLRIGEQYVRAGGTDQWPEWEIHPTTPWNYGLVLDAVRPAASLEVRSRPWPENDQPFTLDGAPVLLRGRGQRIPAWQLDDLGLVGNLQPSPVWSEEPVEEITLVPMGAARLRIAAFPRIGVGDDAHRWTPRSQPQP